jgi:DNA-binding transcriptional LysR family regulator
MDLRQLEAFKSITTTGSFSSAARQLGVTQSALSHQMKSLEEELGEQLLVRARPRVYPTDAGRHLLMSAERIFGEIASIREQFEKSRSGAFRGSVRIAATHIAIAYLYGDLLEQFVTNHPEIEIIFHATETTENPVTRVLQRSADAGFIVLPQSHPQLEVLPMVKAEQVFIVGAKHKLAKRKSVSVEELRRWPFARFEQGTGPRIVSDQVFISSGEYPPVLAESNDIEYVKRLIRMGLGVALVPVFCVRQELLEGTLRPLRSTGGRIMQDAGLIWRKDSAMSSLTLFREICERIRGSSPKQITLDNVEGHPAFSLTKK